MRDKLEKYLLIPRDFPNKAGKLRQLAETQKRLVLELAKSKQTDTVNKLLIAVSESYDVTVDFIDWNYKILKGLEADAEFLKDGAKMRNIIQDQSDYIKATMESESDILKEMRDRLKEMK